MLCNICRIIHGNSFIGTIPKELGALKFLRVLDLGGNMLSGPIPPEIGNLTSIVKMSVDIMDMINVSSGRSKISLKFSYLSSCVVTETSGLMGWLGGCLLSLVIWIFLRNYGWTGISLKELFLVVMVHRLLPTWMDCKYIVRINIFDLVSIPPYVCWSKPQYLSTANICVLGKFSQP